MPIESLSVSPGDAYGTSGATTFWGNDGEEATETERRADGGSFSGSKCIRRSLDRERSMSPYIPLKQFHLHATKATIQLQNPSRIVVPFAVPS